MGIKMKISIHAPTRGATVPRALTSRSTIFQSTLPREERPFRPPAHAGSQNFNPRSHERSDGRKNQGRYKLHISIHAPTRGATKNVLKSPVKALISIHAPTRGATTICFGLVLFIDISIHAPTRGATFFPLALPFKVCISIHAPTRGATHSPVLALCLLLFQSTLPREERRQLIS